MTGKREGPLTTIKRSCFDCAYEQAQKYFVEDGNSEDSGHDVYCIHPAAVDEENRIRERNGLVGNRNRRYIGDTTWETPSWCPFLKDKQQ